MLTVSDCFSYLRTLLQLYENARNQTNRSYSQTYRAHVTVDDKTWVTKNKWHHYFCSVLWTNSGYCALARRGNIVLGAVNRLWAIRPRKRGSILVSQARGFSLLQNIQTDSETKPAFCARRIEIPPPSTGIKQPQREGASAADVKNERSYTSTPAMCLHVLHRDNFTTLQYFNMKYVNIYCLYQHIILHNIWGFYLESVLTFHDEKLKEIGTVRIT